MLVLLTGAGRTAGDGFYINEELDGNSADRVLVLQDTDELIEQTGAAGLCRFCSRVQRESRRIRKIWLFSMILGHSRRLWGQFVASQNLQSVLRCHIGAFKAMNGAPEKVLYDRIKTAVIGEDEAGIITYNAALVALLNHYGAAPLVCRPYRSKTKRKLERPFRYIRQDFCLARSFRNLHDLDAQFDAWRGRECDDREDRRRVVAERTKED